MTKVGKIDVKDVFIQTEIEEQPLYIHYQGFNKAYY